MKKKFIYSEQYYRLIGAMVGFILLNFCMFKPTTRLIQSHNPLIILQIIYNYIFTSKEMYFHTTHCKNLERVQSLEIKSQVTMQSDIEEIINFNQNLFKIEIKNIGSFPKTLPLETYKDMFPGLRENTRVLDENDLIFLLYYKPPYVGVDYSFFFMLFS